MAENRTVTQSWVRMDDGVRLKVRLLDEDPTVTKPLFIALHGAPGLSTLAEPETSYGHLSDIFRVLVYDARGSGDSDLIGPYTHDRWIEDIENLRQWAGAETIVLAGGSHGGFLAQYYAIQHGDKLRGLILRDTFTNGVSGAMTILAAILTFNRNVDIARQVRNWSGTLYNDQDYEEAIREMGSIHDPPDHPPRTQSIEEKPKSRGIPKSNIHSATHNAAFSANMLALDVRPRLKEIKVPTLVVVGRYDVICPVASSQEVANGIPNARLEIFEHSGHSPPKDEPEKFKSVLLDFLKTEVL